MIRTLVFTFIFCQLALAQLLPMENPRPIPWPDRMWRNIVMFSDDVAYSLSQVLFDAIDKFDVKVYDTDTTEVKIKIEREVFDNQDVLNSFSVVDYTSFNLKTEAFNYEFPIATDNVTFGLSLATGGSVDFVNIRQVSASRYAQMPTVAQEYQDLEDDGSARTIDTQSGSFFDPSWRPRTNRLWNFFTIPFRLPTSLKKYQNLEKGELISYGVNGFVEFSAGVGFNVLNTGLNLGAVEDNDTEARLGLELNYRTYLKGLFRITVLKESERFARVKISRARERTNVFTINSGGEDLQLYEGFLIFEGKKLETRILETKVSLLPFKFKAQAKYIKAFDLGFRYDLTDPLAQEAFEHATRGSFAKSQELMDRVDEDENKVVERLFERNAFTHTRSRVQDFDLQIYRRRASRSRESLEAIITLPNGVHKVFKEVRSSDRDWKVIWGKFEKLNYNFIVTLDKTAFARGDENSFQLVAEARIEDSHTNGFEMANYSNMIRKALGKPDILPDLPSRLPLYQLSRDENENTNVNVLARPGIANFRKSSFYYGFNIDQESLLQFINTPKEKMWQLLEKAYNAPRRAWHSRGSRIRYRLRHIFPAIANVPLYLANINLRRGSNVEAARKTRRNWLRAQRELNSESPRMNLVSEYLAEMFRHKHYGHEHLRLLLLSLEQRELDYFLVATNDAFGRIQQRGRVTMNPEYLLNLTDQNIGFERIAGGASANPDILIKNLESEVVDSEEKVKINFELDHDPKIVYFKLFLSNRLKPFYIRTEIAYDNKSRFKKGINDLELDKKALNDLSHKLGAKLLPGNFHSLTISTTKDGFSWSKVATTRFYYEGVKDTE